jgi:DNA-binding NtrC family response regulator
LELLESAEALRAADQAAEAIRKLEEALRLEGPLEAEIGAEIRLRLADCHTEMGDHGAAQDALASLLRSTPDETWRARALTRVARAKCYLGDFDTSMEFSREALQALAGTSLHAETAMAMQWLGNALQEAGRIPEAHEIFRDAVALARLSQEKFRLASCLGSLARLDLQRSQYRDGRDRYQECIGLAESLGHRKEVARGHLNLSLCLFHLGDWARSEQEAELARRLFCELNDPRGEALCLLALCRLARRRREDATGLLAQATKLAEKSGYRRARLLAIEEQADLAREAGNFKRAQEQYGELLQLSSPDAPGGDVSYEVRVRLGLIQLESGQLAEADRLATQALQDATRADDVREQAFILTALARIHQRLGHEEQARVAIRGAIRTLERLETPYDLAQALEAAAEILSDPALLERAHELYEQLGLETRPKGKAKKARFVAVAPKTKKLVATAQKLGTLGTSILLAGETGVGKAVYARFIHESGPRADRYFGVLNCANWSEARMEAGKAPHPSELLERAKGGTVLLKGVDKARPALQELLVGAIEGKGGAASMAGDEATRPQVISTTNEDLKRLVDQARFLKDLYFRLTGFVLNIPPLRERIEDIEDLAEQLAAQELPEDVLEALRKYTWPGNVRELKNALASAVFFAGDAELGRKHLPDSVKEPGPTPQTLPERIEALERREIGEALERTGNNKRAAARALGVSRKGLIDRLKRLDMWDEYGRVG